MGGAHSEELIDMGGAHQHGNSSPLWEELICHETSSPWKNSSLLRIYKQS